MRTRTFVFALVLGTATVALAQDGGYVRFPSPSPQACAVACAGDQMCASWSFGTGARSYGQNQTRSEGAAMCTFSASSIVRNSAGTVSGLPRRESIGSNVPMMSAPPLPGNQSYPMQSAQAQNYGQNSGAGNAATGWDVRPAPWLSGSGSSGLGRMAPSAPQMQPRQPTRIAPPIPAPIPFAAPRIDYEPQAPALNLPGASLILPPPQPAYVAPAYVAPTYVPAPQPATIIEAPSRPVSQQQAPMQPAPPIGTREISGGAIPDNAVIALPAAASTLGRPPTTTRAATKSRPARGVPKGRASRVAPVVAATLPPAESQFDDFDPPSQTDASSVASSATATRRPVTAPAPGRGTPRSSSATQAAPPRQETAARTPAARATPRPPVRDPSDPESFRGPDGMIDSAEMRRAQLNAAREQGTPAYSVQREWEAVAAERQRADAAGEARVDPLAGTVPVAPPPETRAQKRAREAEEAVVAAEEAREAVRASGGEAEEATPPPARRPATRGARGVPRPKPARQTSDTGDATQTAQAMPQRRQRTSRRAPAQALDREPRLSGGPG